MVKHFKTIAYYYYKLLLLLRVVNRHFHNYMGACDLWATVNFFQNG